MSKPPISVLPKAEQKQLFTDLNYLNTAEIKSFCTRHSIPFTIAIETNRGTKKTNEDDRKGVILNRIRRFLKTGVVPAETCFSETVVCFDPAPKKLKASDRLYYGQYDKTNRAMVSVLKGLTQGAFHDGAIARILARDFWTRGKAPTLKEYASAWLRAERQHRRPNAEWAFLSDRAQGTAGPDWKKLRASKAASVIKTLRRIAR